MLNAIPIDLDKSKQKVSIQLIPNNDTKHSVVH